MNTSIKHIEKQLGIILEKHDYDNKNQVHTYNVWIKDNTVSKLTLQNLNIENISVLDCVSKHLHSLTLINCTISHFADIYNFKGLCNLTLDNVVIKDLNQFYPYKIPKVALEDKLLQINLKNMEIQHLSMFMPIAKELGHVFITNCTLHNFYEVNKFPRLYDLRLDQVKIIASDTNVVYDPRPDRNYTWLTLTKMEVEDIDFFIPMAKGVSGIRLYDCKIGSIANLTKLPYLEELEINSKTTIQDKETPINPSSTFYIEECAVGEDHQNEKAIVDLENLASLAPYIQSISFNQYVSNSTKSIEKFTQLNKLTFLHSSVTLQDFKYIVSQIKTIRFEHSHFTSSDDLKYFTALDHLEFDTYMQYKGLETLKALLPLKHQLKKLEIEEDEVKDLGLIKEFTALESLKLWDVHSQDELRNVMSLENLSRLYVYISLEPEPTQRITVSLAQLKKLESLVLIGADKYHFKDLGDLIHLKRLILDCDSKIDDISKLQKLEYLTLEDSINVNTLPVLPSLRKLKLELSEDYEIKYLEHFPNLEYLKIFNTNNIKLGSLPKLKILGIYTQGEVNLETCFESIPNLEELAITGTSITKLNGIEKLTNLVKLDLSENELENLEGIQELQKLELFNLFANNIKKIDVLNSLTNIKEVNLDSNAANEDELLSQLNKPEIALFLGMPRGHFRIGNNWS